MLIFGEIFGAAFPKDKEPWESRHFCAAHLITSK